MSLLEVGRHGTFHVTRTVVAVMNEANSAFQSTNEAQATGGQNADAFSLRTGSQSNWTFLTNHAHVLIVLSQSPNVVLREVAVRVGITERAVQRIVQDLEDGGFLVREKIGRQNHYRVNDTLPLRHPIESHRNIGDLLSLINGAGQ